MSSLSPLIGVTLMGDTDFVNASVIDNNATLMDSIVSITQCTSTTRPANPWNGRWIYETDTQNVRRWSDTGAWHLLGGSGTNSSTGYVGSATDTGAHTLTMTGGSGHQQVSLHDYNFTLQNNKTYKVIEQGWIWNTGPFRDNLWHYNVGLWTNFGIGSNPGLGSGSAIHVSYKYISDAEVSQRIPYYKVMYVNTPGGSGTSVCYFRSVMDLNAADFQPSVNTTIGRSADSIGSTVSVYDMGAPGATN
jgi:hypothetical protein